MWIKTRFIHTQWSHRVSAKKVINETRLMKGNVIGLGVLCNRGGITTEDVANVLKLDALLNMKLNSWNDEDCPLCKDSVPINTDVGKGCEFLARKQMQTT